ncbi:hydroquinone glucosyltransferase-like [Papaver somniferum]|uniref:hydroquinone glucosyltransferase-like n=1 Tax=Papaver somniferum TaxID=3469 RepID=UPI000E6FB413|nr:hydroquinone glucosyltransferase-like [Papaver somniferum]
MEEHTDLLPHVIIIPSPGMGHLIPITEFAKRLVLDHGFSATLLIPTETNSPFEALISLPRDINTIFLSPVDLSDLSKDTEIGTRITATMNRSLPSVSDSVRTITSTHRVVCMVVDLFSTGAIDIANEFSINNAYIFISSTAMLLSSIYHAPKLDQAYSCEYRDVPGLIQIPGCVPIRGADLMNPFEDRKTEAYASFLQCWKKLNLGKGIFINSFEEIEYGAIEVLNGKQWDNPPVYAIGPLTRTGVRDGGSDELGCLKYLDNQPPSSVLFVSFGSGGTLSGEQLTELALGLEMSNQRFLWFLKSPAPIDKAASTCYLSAQSVEDPSVVLPKGFLDRTLDSGMVVSSWAPQVEILSHKSTGGFLSHCGWNSTLESILQGVPLIAWPLFAEQTMNAVMLTENMKVALRPKPMENGIIGRDEICKVVKELMEGEEGKKVKRKMGELKSVATSTLAEGGSSFKTFAKVVNVWKKY